MKASKHKLVTAGCALSYDGKEPSWRCCDARNFNPRSTVESIRLHSSADKTSLTSSSAVARAVAMDEGFVDGRCDVRSPSAYTRGKMQRSATKGAIEVKQFMMRLKFLC